jgi:hypothetical protein
MFCVDAIPIIRFIYPADQVPVVEDGVAWEAADHGAARGLHQPHIPVLEPHRGEEPLEGAVALDKVPPVVDAVELVPHHHAHGVQPDVEDYSRAELLERSGEPRKDCVSFRLTEVEVVDGADLVDVRQPEREGEPNLTA